MSAIEGVFYHQSVSAVRAYDILALSLMSELMTAVSTSGKTARHSESRMVEQIFHSPLCNLGGNGGQSHI